MPRSETTRRHVSIACLIATATMISAGAQEVTIKNDSVTDFSNAVIVGDFVSGEEAGTWLTSTCDGTIVAVQFLWLSFPPGALPVIHGNIWIREAGVFPNPGTDLLQLEGPVMEEGGLNEFRYVDEGQSIPISVPVNDGQTFVVSLEYGEPTNIFAGDASVVRDLDGCQPGRNVLFAQGLGGWVNFCNFLAGDLAIRAIVDCGDAAGACCLPSGQCVDGQTDLACVSAGGAFQGGGSDCGETNCPEPTQACCFMPQGCVDLTLDDCQTAAGFPQGLETECDTVTCFPIGACCLPDGACLEDVSPEGCVASGGVFQGDGISCGQANCPEPMEACCFMPEGCIDLTVDDCQTASGFSQGPETECDTLTCFPTGACCLLNGSCLDDVSPEGCDGSGGVFQGDGVPCGQANCPLPVGACCLSNDSCIELPEDDCNNIPQSSWAGAMTTCEDADKSGVADACECASVAQDGDHDCDVDLHDFQTFVACATGVGIPPAEPFCDCFDADGDGDVDLNDFRTFQAAFTGPGPGCP